MSKVNFEVETIYALNSEFRFSEAYGLIIPHDDNSSNLNYFTNATLVLSMLAPLVILGSCCFSMVGGLGMAYLPVSLIKSYLSRP